MEPIGIRIGLRSFLPHKSKFAYFVILSTEYLWIFIVTIYIDFLKLIKTFSWVSHTGIPGLWMQVLNAGLWTLDAGCYTLDAGLWTLDTVVDCFRTESEPSFWSCLIQLLKIIWVRISKDLMVTLVLQRLSVLTWLFLD